MASDLDYFKRLLYEASEDDPPPDVDDSSPPDLPEEDNSISMDDPPDIGGDDFGGDAPPPPDMDGGGSDFDDGGTDAFDDAPDDENQGQDMQLGQKVSAILNQSLYQQFLKLLDETSSKTTQMKDNTDVLYAITPECTDIVDSLTELKTNLQLYLKHHFVNRDYSQNLQFFNMCLNLLALLDKSFDMAIKKGIKHGDV